MHIDHNHNLYLILFATSLTFVFLKEHKRSETISLSRISPDPPFRSTHFCFDFDVFRSLSCWKIQPSPIIWCLAGTVRLCFFYLMLFDFTHLVLVFVFLSLCAPNPTWVLKRLFFFFWIHLTIEPVLSWQDWQPVWSSVAVAHFLQSPTCCIFLCIPWL